MLDTFKNSGKIVKIVIVAAIVIVSIFYLKSILVRFFGYIPFPYPKGPLIIRENENICVDFLPLESEYTQSAIRTFNCNTPLTVLDEYFTKRCAIISVDKSAENRRLIIKEDWACASGATCDEWEKSHEQCDWEREILSIDNSGKMIETRN